MKSTPLHVKSFVFVDAHLEDIQTLSMHFPHEAELSLLNSDENLLSQIARRLKGHTDVAALHLITHGRSGEILLGKNGVSLETLPLYGKELLTISSAMSKSGELFLYGCEVAYGERGTAFVAMLQDVTGLKIAAATHKVGHEELGGSWELDVMSDIITAKALHVSEWRGVLATTNFTLNLSDTLQWYRPTPDYDNSTDISGDDENFGVFDVVTSQSDSLYSYAFVKFTPSVSGFYDVKVSQTALSDSMIFVYGSDFAVTNNVPGGTLIVGDDDSFDTFFIPEVDQDAASLWSGLQVELTANTDYYLVMSSFDTGDTGNVSFDIVGDGTVAVEGGSLVPDAITLYISGKEQMIINEDANGALSINGFTLGNAGDANDTTTELTVSIAATHGTLTLGTTDNITFTDSTENGGATVEFKGTIANLRTAINSLSYDPEDSNVAADPLTIQISADDGANWQPYTVDVPGKFYYAPNGHYYEFVNDSGITWNDAKTAAEAKTLYGLNGYLATVTSQAENDYITPKLGGDGWMGASDAATEGTWKWVTGPEAGTHFFNGMANADTDGPEDNGYDSSYNSSIDGQFNNFANGEPNNWGRDEDVAHFYSTGDGWSRNAGEWNDYAADNSDIDGYIVEYGGTDFGTLTAANLTIIVNQKPTLTNVVTDIAFTETDAQTAPQLIDSEVTFSEDDVTMNRGSSLDGTLDIKFVDGSDNEIDLYNEFLSFKTQGDIRIDTNNEEIFYQENYIGRFSSNSSGVSVEFNTTNAVPATAVDILIQSLTYKTNDAPMSAAKLKIVATDNTGLAGDPVYINVTVTTENDAPTIIPSGGVMTTDIDPETWDEAYSILQLSGGKFVVVGTSGDDDYLTLIRYNADGSLDTEYGTDGKSVIPIVIDSYQDAAVDTSGNVFMTGKKDEQGGTKYVVIKVDSDGALATGFGTDGIATSYLPSQGTARGIEIQDDGKIVTIARQGDQRDFFVERFNADGTSDSSFGNPNGYVSTDFSSGEEYGSDIAIQSDGKIVVVGYTDDGDDKFAIARYNTNGTLDTTFNTTGKIVEDNSGVWSGYSNYLYPNKVVIQSDGKILVGGSADGDGLLLVRYNTNGTLDNTFGTGGKLTIDQDQYDIDDVNDMVVDSSGNIFVLGDDDFVVTKFTSSGVLDNTFGTGGIAQISISGYGDGSTLFVDANGKLLITGEFEDGDTGDGKFLVARLNADGTPDMDFGSKASFEKGGDAVLLDSGISVNDPDVAEYDGNYGGDYNGFTLTIAREDGTNANDVFSAIDGGDLTLTDGNIVIYDDEEGSDATVGTYTQGGGTLMLAFNSDAYKYEEYSLVNQVARNIAYENTDSSLTEDTTVNLVWTFSDTVTSDTFVQTVNITIPEPEATSSVTLDVTNPFTPDANDTTAITITAPEGINISNAENSAITGLPKNVKMPLGQFGFTLGGVEEGGTVEMSMTADADFKQFSYFKKNLVTNKWVNIMEGVTINDNGTASVKFSLTDGGVFDADRTVNGVIVDPGGIGENALLPMIAENTTEVGNISLLDETLVSGAVSYEITGGADAAKFTVDASTGLLNFNSAPDYESPTDTGDTEDNNTYAVQVTLTGSISGSEVQNLTVSVLNVAEEGDNANTAPIIVGLRAEAQEVTAGTSVALDDIRVADSNGDTMTITLTAVNGTIGGLTDADAEAAGIQLTGTAATINTALASAIFTASSAGAASVNLSVTDTAQSGTAITTTSVYNLSASVSATPPSGGGGSTPTTPTTPPATTTTVDGTTVQTATVTQARTTTDASGNTTTTTVSTEQLIIAPVSVTRTDSTGTATTADVPLFWGESSRTEWATTANLPTGVGLTTAGSRAPETTATQQSALADLLYYIDTTTPSSDLGKAEMLSGGATFLSALANIQTLVVNQITLSTTNTEASQVPITITGVANTVVTTDGAIAPVEALVIDAQSLQAGSMLNLQNVEFAVIIGENLTIRGGDGQNILFTGAGSQNIMLGEDDDQLYAGDGDDTVGSAGGDDSIFGEGGDDTVFGGEGNDMLHGGSEEDVATYSGNMSDYVITRDEGKTYVALASNPNEVDTLINVENIEFADSSYTIENSITLSKIATLYMHILDRQAEIDGFQYWAKDTTGLGNIALGFITSVEYKTNSGVNWETLDVSGKVEQFYEALLGRSSDEVGKAYWVDAINAGMTFEQAVEGFIDSVELSGIYQSKEDWNFGL